MIRDLEAQLREQLRAAGQIKAASVGGLFHFQQPIQTLSLGGSASSGAEGLHPPE
jgi:hypothetical protein